MQREAILDWQYQMGVNETLTPDIVDQTAKPLGKATPNIIPVTSGFSESPTITPVIPKTTPSIDEQVAEAHKLSIACNSLEDLYAAIEGFNGLAIKKTASNTVFSDGNPNAEIMFIGEAPGANEDKEGIPFCGAAGKLMDSMVATIGLSRSVNCYITNTLFWRPPGNRRPTPEELAICKPFVEKHIALIAPKLIVLWGGTATSVLLTSDKGITKLRGQWYDYKNEYLSAPIHLTAVFHPSYLLRQPVQKRLIWQDLLSLQHYIRTHAIKMS